MAGRKALFGKGRIGLVSMSGAGRTGPAPRGPFLAEDNVRSVSGNTEDQAYDRFVAEYDFEPLRILRIIKRRTGGVDAEVVWENDEADDDDD